MITFLHIHNINNIFSYFCEIFSHLHFCSIFLVQFWFILVRNNMFYIKTKSSNLVTMFYYVIDIAYITYEKKCKKN